MDPRAQAAFGGVQRPGRHGVSDLLPHQSGTTAVARIYGAGTNHIRTTEDTQSMEHSVPYLIRSPWEQHVWFDDRITPLYECESWLSGQRKTTLPSDVPDSPDQRRRKRQGADLDGECGGRPWVDRSYRDEPSIDPDTCPPSSGTVGERRNLPERRVVVCESIGAPHQRKNQTSSPPGRSAVTSQRRPINHRFRCPRKGVRLFPSCENRGETIQPITLLWAGQTTRFTGRPTTPRRVPCSGHPVFLAHPPTHPPTRNGYGCTSAPYNPISIRGRMAGNGVRTAFPE